MKYLVCVLLCLAVCLISVTAQPQPRRPAKMTPEKAEQLRKKYSGGGFVRDIEHIKEDLKHLIQYSGDGTFTTEESIFYVMRMHDFDDNNQIDGLELLRAFGHAHGEDGAYHYGEETPMETLVQLVDETMQYDTNSDGLLSFAEWVKGHNGK